MAQTPPVPEISFAYTARDTSGQRKKGRVMARSALHATQKLREQGLYPIDIAAAGADTVQTKSGKTSTRRLSQRQKAEMIARLGKLTSSQINLDRALSIMAEGQDGALSVAAGKLRVHMREGGALLDGLRDHLDLDDPATLALVRGAEISGDLSEALATAAGILQQRLMMVRRVMTGLLYPSLLLIVAILSVGLIMIAIIPQFRPLVEDRMDMIPFLGRSIFALSATLSAIWPLLISGVVIGAFVMWLLHRRGKAMPILRRIVARFPLVGGVISRNQVMIMLHILGALLRREVTLSEALRVVSETAPTGAVKSSLRQVSTSVETGEALSSAFTSSKMMPPAAIEMVRIGEETGDLSGMIERAADEMREAADRELERFLALFQPALIIIVGLLVGVSLYALFSAIVSVNSITF